MLEILEKIRSDIRTVPDFPRPGILFFDITTILSAPHFTAITQILKTRYEHQKIDFVAGVESRGFIFGAALAYAINAGFVPIRKPNKLPAQSFSHDYDLEYGSSRLEIHADAFSSGSRVILIDDLIATGGSAQAAEILVEKAGGKIIETCFVIEISELHGAQILKSPVFSLIKV